MRRSALLFSLALLGCGADLSGTYSGQALESTTCADGSGGSQNLDLAWTLVDRGSSVSVITGGTCGDLTGIGSMASVVIQAQDCSPGTSSWGGAIYSRIQTGDISQDSTGIAISLEVTATGAVSCTTTINGRLAKR